MPIRFPIISAKECEKSQKFKYLYCSISFADAAAHGQTGLLCGSFVASGIAAVQEDYAAL